MKVHIVGDATKVEPRPERRRVTLGTVVLTADDTAQELLPPADDRVCAYILSLDNDVVIGKDKATVMSPSNTKTNVPQPSGAVVPKSLTAWTPLETSDRVWAGVTTTATNSRVSVISVYRA